MIEVTGISRLWSDRHPWLVWGFPRDTWKALAILTSLWLPLIQPQPFKGHAIKWKPLQFWLPGPALQVLFCKSGVEARKFPLSSILTDSETAQEPHIEKCYYYVSSMLSSPKRRKDTYKNNSSS